MNGKYEIKMIRAKEESAELIGKLHATAWKQTYQNVFKADFIDQDSMRLNNG